MTMKNFHVAAISAAGDVRESRSLGHHLIRITGPETGDALGVWEELVEPEAGAPLHVHHRKDEMFHVLEGRFRIWCGEESFEAPRVRRPCCREASRSGFRTSAARRVACWLR